MDDIRREAEGLVRAVSDASDDGGLSLNSIDLIEAALRERDRKARLEENLACEKACAPNCDMDCADEVAKRRGVE